MKMEWISIKDELPKMECVGLSHSDIIAVLTKNNDRFIAVYAEELAKEPYFWNFYNGEIIKDVTHWFPLPKPIR